MVSLGAKPISRPSRSRSGAGPTPRFGVTSGRRESTESAPPSSRRAPTSAAMSPGRELPRVPAPGHGLCRNTLAFAAGSCTNDHIVNRRSTSADTPRRAAPADVDLLVRASRLYYLEERGQAEIARLLRISRPGVSRLLRRAREARIVEIRVRETTGREDWESLQRQLGVKELQVAAEAGNEAVGALGARWFERTVRRGDLVGLTAGTTLSAFVHAVAPARPVPVEIVPLVGALWDTGEDYDGSFLCQELRRRTGGTHHVLSAPAVVRDGALMRSLRAEPRVRNVLERYGALDSAYLGIGAVSEDHPIDAAAA